MDIWRSSGNKRMTLFSIDDLVCTRKETMFVPLFTSTMFPLLPTIVTELGTTAAAIIIHCQESES
jgi:hypothetical protein